jgi:hypothetical protein
VNSRDVSSWLRLLFCGRSWLRFLLFLSHPRKPFSRPNSRPTLIFDVLCKTLNNLISPCYPLSVVVAMTPGRLLDSFSLSGRGLSRSYLHTGTLAPLISFVCHSYENTRGVGVFFPVWNVSPVPAMSRTPITKSLPYFVTSLRPYFLSSKFFSWNTYGPPRKCCKQKTYSGAKRFRCNTYKKTGGRGLLWLTRFASSIAVPGNPRSRETYLYFSPLKAPVSLWQSCFKASSAGAAMISRTRSRSAATSSFVRPLVSMVSWRRTVTFAGQIIQWPVR